MAESAKNLSFFNFQFFFKAKSLRFLILNFKETIKFVFGTNIKSLIIFLLILFFGVCIRLLILILPFLFYKKNYEIQQIERGFQTIFKTSNKTFRINFFYILIIFIIFDLELVFIFSFIESINFIFTFGILFFIFFTLLLEWSFNKIKWIN